MALILLLAPSCIHNAKINIIYVFKNKIQIYTLKMIKVYIKKSL